MKILIWNTRGLGDEEKNTLIFKQISEADADIICIQETKLADINIFKAKQFLPQKYTGYTYQPAVGTAGGLMIA
jgi:exonuclease III